MRCWTACRCAALPVQQVESATVRVAARLLQLRVTQYGRCTDHRPILQGVYVYDLGVWCLSFVGRQASHKDEDHVWRRWANMA